MSYTHTSIVLSCEADVFCADCANPLPQGSPARRRVTDTGAPEFKVEWLCAGACGPIIDVSDDTLMRKRIAELEERLAVSEHNRTMALELAQQSQDEATRLAEQLNAARGAQGATATTIQGELERQARARLVREVEFVRAVRASVMRSGGSITALNELMHFTSKAMKAIEQDELIERMAERHLIELQARHDIVLYELGLARQGCADLKAERDEIDAELAAERAAHRQTAANLSAQLTPARGPRAHIVTDKDQ